jgi:phosphoglucosamine mutase
MERYPQLLINVPVRERRDLSSEPRVAAAIEEVERTLGDRGRVLVRPSGTEALMRVMVEGEHEADVRRHAEAIAVVIREVAG